MVAPLAALVRHDPRGSWRAPRATPGDGSRRLPGRIGRQQRPPWRPGARGSHRAAPRL